MILHHTSWLQQQQKHQQGGLLSTWQITSPQPTLFVLLHITKYHLPPLWFTWSFISNSKILISTVPPSHRNINSHLLLLHPHVQLLQALIQRLDHLFLSVDAMTTAPLIASILHHIQKWLCPTCHHLPHQLIYPLKHSLHNTSFRYMYTIHILLSSPFTSIHCIHNFTYYLPLLLFITLLISPVTAWLSFLLLYTQISC